MTPKIFDFQNIFLYNYYSYFNDYKNAPNIFQA
jgi:hypothetical protein